MSTVTAILEPDVDGDVHLPVPAELRGGKVKVVATLARAELPAKAPRKAGSLKGEFWMSPDFDAPLDELKDYME